MEKALAWVLRRLAIIAVMIFALAITLAFVWYGAESIAACVFSIGRCDDTAYEITTSLLSWALLPVVIWWSRRR